jgi:para-aminobenzoate synthetase component 1
MEKRHRCSKTHVVIEGFEGDAAGPRTEHAAVTFSRATAPSILETSLMDSRYGRFSVFACEPADTFVVRRTAGACPFTRLANRMSHWPTATDAASPLPFAGGWIGYFAYEASLGLERLRSTGESSAGAFDSRFCLYDSSAVFDHELGTWHLAAIEWPRSIAGRRLSVTQRLALLRRRLQEAARCQPSTPESLPARSAIPEANMTYDEYIAKVERAKRYIEAGDIYQVNLTQRFTLHTDATPIELYLRLRESNPSTHAALITWGDQAVISSSPELFLDLRGRDVITRPIKGTRPRGCSREEDEHLRQSLRCSEKDTAELNMIIDLLRNDLGRVCSFGSVRVLEQARLETHPTVHHLVATIRGSLRPDASWVDLLRASFPGGSITGVPKIRAMQIIDELEPTRRGVYCGSIGYIGLDGSACLNIAIRTMRKTGSQVNIHAGGAIVADSDPHAEYEEILAKAEGMFRATGAVSPADERPLVLPRLR